ncbi:DUF2804 domain-containing protein [Myxococcaceae bacterium GXIMD 01537]
MAREILRPTDLCDSRGRLSPDSVGWARHPLIRCNVSGSFLRKKKWNYWCVTSPELLLSATISHLDYAAVMFVYALDLRTFGFHEQTVLVPFGHGCELPEEVNASVRFENGKGIKLAFDESSGATRLQIHWPSFGKTGKPLSAALTVHRPAGYESLNVVVPWSETRFQFTSKQPALPVSGTVSWEGTDYTLSEKEAFGCLDFGRGIWPYSSTWNWAAASGVTRGRTVGLNLGGKWTDGTGQTENGFLVDGRLHKVHEDIRWTYDRTRFMDPWTLTTVGSERVSLRFQPLFERVAATKAVVIRSEVHQMIGHFQGHVVTDEGERVEVEKLLGWAEDHSAHW